jgi:putative ABC transport system permease protein
VLRWISRHRSYLLLSTGTLSVAVGANILVFTVVNALWLRPLPFPAADRLVVVAHSSPYGDAAFFEIEGPSWRPFEATAGQVIVNDHMSGLRPLVTLAGVERQMETLGVTSGYFRLFRLSIRGRDFTSEDDRRGAEPVAIISDRLWTREFNRRADVIGALVNGSPFTLRIIGVAPPDFHGARRGEVVDIWVPTTLVPRASRMPESSRLPLMVFGRLHPGQSVQDVARRFRETALDERERELKERLAIVPLSQAFGTPESRTIIVRESGALSVVAGLAMLILLGGCATLMALVLVHYERRRRELAIKTVLGASRLRIVKELSRELAVLIASGTVGAVLVAAWGLRALPALTLPGGVNLGRLDLSIDWRVLGAAVLSTIFTLVLATLVPMRRTTRLNLALELVGGSAATSSVSSRRVRQTLLAFQVVAAIVVLVVAGLFVRAVAHGVSGGAGFDVDQTLFVSVQTLSPLRVVGPAQSEIQSLRRRTTQTREALRTVPGVQAVAEGMPPVGLDAVTRLSRSEVVETRRQRHEIRLGRMFGTADLLGTIGVPILFGRGLTDVDATPSPFPAVVTSTLADSLWPGENPLGQLLSLEEGRERGRYFVVGVAADFCFGSFSRPAAGVLVTVRHGAFGIEPQFAVRATHATAIVDSVRKAIHQTLPDAPWVKVETGWDIVGRDLGPQRLGAWFFSGFGLVALILGVGGVFGLVAYLAESQRFEFGVRLALGATRRDVIWQTAVAALYPVSLGTAVGVGLAAGVAHLLTSLLAGLSALDPLTYAIVATTLLSSATLAAVSAAWRLRRLDASHALRAH